MSTLGTNLAHTCSFFADWGRTTGGGLPLETTGGEDVSCTFAQHM